MGSPLWQARALHVLGDVLEQRGLEDQALSHRLHAGTLFAELGTPEAAGLQGLLDAIDAPGEDPRSL